MAERKKIGLVYNYDENWVAGTYYIANIIRALQFLPIERQPEIILIHKSDRGLDILKEINYHYILFYYYDERQNSLSRILNKLSRSLGFENIITDKKAKALAPGIYPANWVSYRAKHNYFWIPDLQEDYYPEFFSPEVVTQRKQFQKKISRSGDTIVFSSIDSQNDFLRLYPEYNATLKVLPFASVLPEGYRKINADQLLKTFKIKKPYFFVPNQFWQHKDHLTVLKAIRELSGKNLNFSIIFTGKEEDHRNLQHINTLKNYIKEHSLQEYVLFLGFIKREEQLTLMNEALAIIQPSLFEGWSTVVEDAKALNKHVILSDLPVHLEQMKTNVTFFRKQDAEDLAHKIENYLHHEPKIVVLNYRDNIIAFAELILETF